MAEFTGFEGLSVTFWAWQYDQIFIDQSHQGALFNEFDSQQLDDLPIMIMSGNNVAYMQNRIVLLR